MYTKQCIQNHIKNTYIHTNVYKSMYTKQCIQNMYTKHVYKTMPI